ncbi:hypothetical protein [Idiomarina loihiensis]|jgi:hypothetical protein|uniref:Predicted secreted protein n=1 Tax=Idiomarina loihiensis (strain ATCC BAA-735 / DSM 15497 / L2-TR) TaxID=283942 RepID=Q5QZG0_IDILO|nr:hypothetical protein [Idiomarina loihiensis]AAV83435.1 Predicted secreted protein [Idiomarina loihiensis L2TR]AGM37478.1 hypothetical protein K734_13095 [Idiomarina loihiensis GSL 199]MBL4855678.1 hypothetical protein [Idiomarina sp.]
MNILKRICLVSTFTLAISVHAEELHFTQESSTFVEILSSQYIATIKGDSSDKVDFYTKNQDLVNSVSLDWKANHAWRLSKDYFLVASLKRAPDPEAYNQAVLFKGDKIVEHFRDVKNIHSIPGGEKFAIETATGNDEKKTHLKIFDVKKGFVKEGRIPRTTRFSTVSISPDLNSVAISPFSTDSSSVLNITVYSGDNFSSETDYNFDNTRIYQTIPLANGLVAINVNRRIAAMSEAKAEWTIPNKQIFVTVDVLKQTSDPNYIIAEENTGRVVVIGLDGSIAFDSKDQEDDTFEKIEQNGAYIDVVNDQLIINDSNRGEALIIPLKKPKQVKHIREVSDILAIDVASGYIAFKKKGKLKIKKIN